MSAAAVFLSIALQLSMAMLGLAFALLVVRIVRGPTLPDRVLGLDTMTGVAVSFVAVYGMASGRTLAVDIAIALGLVGFLATVAFARFIRVRGRVGGSPDDEAGSA